MKKAKKTVKAKKATKKLVAVKTVKKKVVKKVPAKKTTKKVAPKVVAPKPAVKRSSQKEVITAQPITDETGVVVMRSVDEQDDADENQGIVMKAVMDNGVLTLVPDED